MRELKFRTWDKNRQSFIGPVTLLGDQKYVVLPENWPWENYCEAVNLSTSAKTIEEAVKQRDEYARENWIVQQWTSLSDVKGDDIYEGDIVKYNPDDQTIEREGTIEWSDYYHGWVIRDKQCYPESNYGVYSLASPFMSFNDVEIIGHIFEDSALLG
jgi:hypothetical protein